MHTNGTPKTLDLVDVTDLIEVGPQMRKTALEYVRLPNGELALLRAVEVEPEPEPEPRYVLTDQGRRDLAMAMLFDRGPSVAELVERGLWDTDA